MDLLKSINVFQAVAKQQSFSRAADHLNLVPSAVSRQINELEKWLGVRLINRTTRSLHLTEEGWHYLEKMDMIRVQVEQLKVVQQDSQAMKGHIKLTAPLMMGQ
ncbi:MAG: LysR family transcriptional regulator for bpeEF and oprC [Psychromonas sp.]|jgi:LysR family transcriptional regulator for bpeEF and oprC